MNTPAPLRTPTYAAEVGIVDFLGVAAVVFEAATQVPSPALLRTVEAFEAAAQAGMFSRHPAATTVPMQVEGGGVSQPQRVRRAWRVTGMQIGAWRVLLSMLDALHHEIAPLAYVRLVSSDIAEPRLAWHDVIRSPFPRRSAALPFDLRIDRSLEDTSEPLIRLTFERDIDDAALQQLIPLFAAWDRLVLCGGYVQDPDDRDPVSDIEERLGTQQTYLAARDTVEHLLYEEVGVAAAFDAVVNMAVKLDLGFGRVAALEFN